MEKAQWNLTNNKLILIQNNCSYIPKAYEIYLAEFKNKRKINNWHVDKPSESINNINFSKFPLVLSIKIFLQEESFINNESLFRIKIFGKTKKDGKVIENPLTRKKDYIIINDKWIPFPRNGLSEIRQFFKKYDIPESGQITLKQYFNLIKKPPDAFNLNYDTFETEKLSDYINSEILKIDSSSLFEGELFSYQEIGYKWLKLIEKEDLGCILADEMGLGKTIQVICLIAENVEHDLSPSLILVPATLMENWKREFRKFAPSISTFIHHGSRRPGLPSYLEKFDVIITSYATLIVDIALFKMIDWNIVVLDEAQAIRNPETSRAVKTKQLSRRVSIAVTGTPIQNRITDIWSLLDFSVPGLLGSLQHFEETYENDVSDAIKLEPIISPLILRRTIEDVGRNLPEKYVIPIALSMTQKMIRLYEEIRLQTIKNYEKASGLVNLQRLRMFCSWPGLVIDDYDGDPAEVNPKYLRLVEILSEVFENKEKAVIFTAYRDMVDLFISDLPLRFNNLYIDWIDGRVPSDERQKKVDDFNNYQGIGVLVLNTRAAGTGLNITGANHVIHYSLEWNPSDEDQASARVYRTGQTKVVRIHRLFYINTVDEYINERLEQKRVVIDHAIQGVKGEEDLYEEITKALEKSPEVG